MSKGDEVRLLSSRWLVFSGLGILMMSAGLVALMQAATYKMKGMEATKWGTVLVVAIILFNAGISFIGTSIKYRIYLDRKRKHDSEFRSGSGEGISHRHSSHRSSRSRRRISEGYDS